MATRHLTITKGILVFKQAIRNAIEYNKYKVANQKIIDIQRNKNIMSY